MSSLPFASQNSLEEKVVNAVRETLENNLYPIWRRMYGMDETIFTEKLNSMKAGFLDILHDMVTEEQQNEQLANAKYNDLLQEAETLERELSIQVQRRDTGREPLYGRIKSLEQDLETHRVVRRERMAILQTLQREEMELCTILQQPCIYADFNSVPSVAKLTEIRTYIQALEKTSKDRRSLYSRLRKQILELWSKLELIAVDSFELQVQADELQNELGEGNIKKLETLLAKLETAETEMNSELETLQYKLTTLWNRLNTEAKERERFLTTNTRCCVSTIQAFKQEIEVCTALKLTRIKDIVGSIRNELEDWWSRVHFGQEQRDQFVEFTIEHDITNEILEKHEKEVENVKRYFEHNREVIELLEQRFELWEQMIHLEDKANDKDRLFSNRGGQLLTEEKKRKFLQKELPKLEHRLEQLFDVYEATYKTPFLFDGQNARELIVHQREEKNGNKENAKQAKKFVVSAVASSSKSRLLGPLVQNSTRHTPGRNGSAILKRKAELTPVIAKRKLYSEHETKGAVHQSRLPTVSKLLSTTRKPQPVGSKLDNQESYCLFKHNITPRKRSSSVPHLNRNKKNSAETPLDSVAQSSAEDIAGNTIQKPTPRSRLVSPKIRINHPYTNTQHVHRNGIQSSNLARSQSQVQLHKAVRCNFLTTRTPLK